MEPILSLQKPTASIGQIQVFPAIYNDLDVLYYPVQVDDWKLAFYLDENTEWVYRETVILPEIIRQLVGDLIEGYYA